ncbi:MAG TPA: amino acid permease [Capillimicrobium sp.]|jgi:amino acid efflux transporter
MQDGTLGVARGAALYVGSLVGPGVLLVPSLAVQEAGPATVIAWVALLVLSLPLAITFATLGMRHPVSGGVSAYVAEGLGQRAAAITGTIFFGGVVIGAPAVALIGGFYVADLAGGGTPVAVTAGLIMFATVVAVNTLGLRVSSAMQMGLSAVLVAVVVLAVATALPGNATEGWEPFAPHGWLAVGTAASLLAWLFFGWEAMAQMAGDFRDPRRDLPRAVTIAYATIAVLYLGLAVATITVATGASEVPLADLLETGLGSVGRDATAVLAVALTMGTMNVYVGGAAKLAGHLARDGSMPAWLGGGAPRTVPRRPLAVLGVAGIALLGLLAAGLSDADGLVRATSACFVTVYVLALASACRILEGRGRLIAAVALVLVTVVTAFSAAFLVVPALLALVSLSAAATTARRRRR